MILVFIMLRLDLSGKLNRLDEMLGQKGEAFKKRVRVIYADLRADINDQLSKDIGDIQVIPRLASKTTKLGMNPLSGYSSPGGRGQC